ncbi:hypothetical protein F441_13155 [Phytophthora nicotianae CJ01A1]|uniref:Uncharacterized protein n=2 Tax=Phytophthora nicotianae TaxID=4792 RepID=W2WLV3_PHYNI|nr:hypothetical protein F444_13275 [Phytophthora nicotianae P1976]ETP11327.1 hypothetical protein F441_13155 [Phytophthora nicotianae CJ01A1]
MEGREWNGANYEEEKSNFLEKLSSPEATVQASKAAKGKWDKKKRLVQKLKAAREHLVANTIGSISLK